MESQSTQIVQVQSRDLVQLGRGIPAGVSFYVVLWSAADRPALSTALAAGSIQPFIEHARLVCETIRKRRLPVSLLGIGSDLWGPGLLFDSAYRQFLRNITKALHQFTGGRIPITHQGSTYDEMEFVSRLDDIDALDVTSAWNPLASPERAFRAVSAYHDTRKPVAVCLDRAVCKRLSADRLRKTLWSMAVAGITMLAGSDPRCWGTGLMRNLSRIGTFLENFSNIEAGEFAPWILRSGRYWVRRIAEQEFMLYSPYGGRITLDCKRLEHPIVLRWYNPRTGRFYRNDIALWDRDLVLKPPFSGDAAIVLRAG